MTENKHLYTFVHAVGKITLGLLLHPYQTMQSLVQERTFVWMTLLPTVVLALVTALWKYITVPIVSTVFSCYTNQLFCIWIPFVSDWLTFFCLFWQVMLIYLVYRFKWAFDSQ